jgi:phage terminase large subunit
LEKLGSKLSINRINLYYVVPTVLFNRFQKQDFVGDIQEQYKWKYRINQYVLGIDISSIGPKPDPGSDFNVIRSRNVSEADGSIRKPDSTWKNDDRICYNCGKKGHITRYCKSRKQ